MLALEVLALVSGYRLGQHEYGRQAAATGARIAQAHNIKWGLAHCLFQEGQCAYLQGDFVAAKEIGDRALQIAQEVGDTLASGACATHLLAPVAIALGNYDEAARQLHQGRHWYHDVEDGWGEAVGCMLSGQLGLLTHDDKKAAYWLGQAIIHHHRTGRITRILFETLCSASQLFELWGHKETAIEVLTFVQGQQVTEAGIHDRVIAALSQLELEVPTETYATAVTQAAEHDIDSMIAYVLEVLDG